MIIEYIKRVPLVWLLVATNFVILCQLSLSWKDNRRKIIFAVFTMHLLPIVLMIYNYPYRMFLFHINDIIWFKFLFHKKLKDIIVPYYITILFTVLVELPVGFIVTSLIGLDYTNTPYWAIFLIFTIIFVIVSILCWLLPIKKFYNKYKHVLERYIPILLIVVILMYFFSNEMSSFDYIRGIHIFLISTLLALIIFSFLQVRMEDQEEKILIRNYEQQKSLVFPLIEEVRSKQHDFKNHITTIYGFSQQNNSEVIENIQTYIEDLNQHLKDIDIFLHIKNKVISSILYSKMCESELKGIDLHFEIPPYEIPVPLADYEYVAVLGNLLDNAFEVPMKSDHEKKEIIFKLTDDSGSSILEVWNNGIPINSKDMSNLFRKGYSTKENKTQRGYGLYNVKRIVDKYNGNIEILQQSNLTGFRICFPSS